MAILTGGIFSNPRGKVGGLVFGAARTRTGKKVTSRLLVPPSNPNTAAQQVQRSKFAEALAIVRLLGSGIYQGDFNRSIGQLPGFQSLTSIYLNSMDENSVIQIIPPINLGSLHKPDTFTAVPGASGGGIQMDWSVELGLNGTDNDVVVFLVILTGKGDTPLERRVVVDTTQVRSDASFEVLGSVTGVPTNVLMYIRGVGAAEDILAPTTFVSTVAG